MVNRPVFTLAAVMMMLFLLVSGLDRFFFLLHFLEALIYVVILLLLYYGLVEWAYLMGILAPLLWSFLSVLSGLLPGSLEGLMNLEAANPSALVVSLLFVTGLALAVTSWRSYLQEVWSGPGGVRTLLLWLILNGLICWLLSALNAGASLLLMVVLGVLIGGSGWLLVRGSRHALQQLRLLLEISAVLLIYYTALAYAVLHMARPAEG